MFPTDTKAERLKIFSSFFMNIPGLINKLFEKKGVNKITDLSPDEKKEYDRWQSIMDGTEITVAKIKEFCEIQIKMIEEKFATPDNSDKKDAFLKASLHIYISLLKLINSPETERANLEKHLSDLINQQ